MLFESIAISKIDSKDELFRLESMNILPLQWDGCQPLHNPVWLQRIDPSTFRIIDGFKVIDLAKNTRLLESIPAMVFPEDSSLTQLWKQRAQKRELEGNLSTISFLRGLARLMNALQLPAYHADKEDTYFPSDIGQQVIKRNLLNSMVEKSQFYESFTDIHHLGYKELCFLDEKPQRYLDDLSRLMEGMQVKGKKLTSLLELIEELNRGFNIQLADLLADNPLATIRAETPTHQRYRRIKSRLLMLRFPQLTQLNSDWDDSLKQAGLGDIVEVKHDPYFENDFLQFVFSPRNTAEFKQQLEMVLNKTDSPELDCLFNFV